MGLETGTYIDDLNASNPTSGDGVTQGDDHLRLIKSTIKATFPNIDGAVTPTQAELNLMDGCTATTAELNNADADTSGGGFLIGPTSSSDPSLAFDTWRQPSTTRATLVSVSVEVETDGAQDGEAQLQVDDSGGTTSDYGLIVRIGQEHGANVNIAGTMSTIVPAGGQYQIENTKDGAAVNQILEIREITL